MAKAIPASGVLNAAATPAAPPAISTPGVTRTRNRRCTATIVAAPNCTVGPSRPTEAPPHRASRVSSILAEEARRETSAREARPRGWRLAAMTCGMPDPRASGAKRRVSAAIPTNTSGVSSRWMKRWWPVIPRNSSRAWSPALANTSAMRPMSRDATMVAMRLPQSAGRTRSRDTRLSSMRLIGGRWTIEAALYGLEAPASTVARRGIGSIGSGCLRRAAAAACRHTNLRER